MPAFIDSRFKRDAYATMQTAVADAQQKRATIAGPPPPTPSFDMQGVEKRAMDALKMQQNQGPMPPMIVNGGMPFGRPAAARSAPAPMMVPDMRSAPPSMMGGLFPPSMMSAPMPPMNALSRGAPAGMGSMLGGPRPAGGRSANDPMRIAEQARRRGDPSLIMGLAQQQQGQQFQREMFGAQQNAMNERDQVNFGQGLQMFGAQQAAMNERDAMNFQQQQQMFQQETARRAGESDLDWQRRREAAAADRAAGSVVGAEPMQMPGGGFVPMVTRADGRRDMAGGFVPGPKPVAPPPPGLEPTQAMIGGVQYEKPPTGDTKPPAFTYEKDPNGKITGAVYPVQDPKTGAWKLQRADLNGDGVVSPEEAAQIPAPTLAAAPVKTKGGNSYTLK